MNIETTNDMGLMARHSKKSSEPELELNMI